MSSLLPTTPEGASAGAELVTSDGRQLALVAARLVGEAQGGLARLVLEQRFENTYDDNLRVTYRMPLPADGAVSGYAFEIGERTITGTIDRKHQARERFERAVASGYTAALLEQERADIFTQQIGNIPARESVIARITIDQRLVWLPEGEWELRFPTVIGPRYIGSADTAADVRATHVKVSGAPLRAGIQIAIDIRDAIVGGGKASSPTHLLERGPGSIFELRSQARLDRDIVVRWPVATPAVGLSLASARPPAGHVAGNDAFGLLTIVPPARDAKPVAVPRDLIVLLDTSGSMSGGPLDKAKQVIAMMIDSLDDHDRFELIEFSDRPRRYVDEPVVATAKAKQAAIKWLRARQADGATEMRAAVIEALTTLRIGAQRQVVVVTDGYVGGERQILEALNRRLPRSCRLHVLGVGSAVNRSLASSLARAGRGVEVIVGVDEDAERGAKRLLDRTRMPVLTNVEISGSALLRHAPELVPDVFEGAPLVAALALRADGGELVVRGQLARESWEQTIRVPALQAGDGNQAIVALYGRERVADVEAHALFASVDGEIEELGLTFQIATRMTSWLAVDETRRVSGPTRDQLIPQELPYGTSASAFGLRTPAAMAAPPAPAAMRTMMGMTPMPKLEIDLALGAPMAASTRFDIEGEADVGEEESADAPRAYAGPGATTRAGSIGRGAPPAYDEGDLDDFALEAPTGTHGIAPHAPDAAAEPPAPARASAPPPPAARARAAAAQPAPPPAAASTQFLRVGDTSEPSPAEPAEADEKREAQDVSRASRATHAELQAAPLAPRKKQRVARIVWLLAVLAAIIALVWWLLG